VLAIGLCWWNPLFWVIRREIRYYAELSCDAWALWAYPTGRRVFAEALIESQERTQAAPMAIEGLCATNTDFKNFERRLTMIMSRNVSRQVSKGAATAALLTTLLVLPGFSVQEKSREEKGKTTQCIDELVEAKQLLNGANKLYGAQQFDDALKAYQQVLALDPGNGIVHGRIGYILGGKGAYKRASKHFKTQVKLGHEVPTAVYNLSCMAAMRGESEQALALLQQSVRRGFTNGALMAKDSDLASLHGDENFDLALELAEESQAMRKYAEALKAEKDAAGLLELYHSLGEIASEDGPLQDKCGLAFLLAKDYKAGLQAFERQVAVGHDVGRGYYNIACSQSLLGQQQEALNAIEQAAAAGMSHAAILEDKDLASLHGEVRFEEAAKSILSQQKFKKKLKKAVSSDDIEKASYALANLLDDEEASTERQAWAAFELGRLQLKAEKLKASVVSFRRAVESGYSPSAAAFQIGSAHVKMGDYKSALKHYDQSLVLGYADPKSMAQAIDECGLADSKQGQSLVKRAELAQKKTKGKRKKKAKQKTKPQAKRKS
jgi:tetratricopeptide (TPR) repeat protein